MNELYISTNAARIRKTLLTTASALVLAAYGESAQAADNDRPTVWIEGGSQFESLVEKNNLFVPPLDADTRSGGFPSLTTLEDTLGKTYGGQGSISFQPNGSDWVFTASARYGRVQTTRRTVNTKTVVGPQLKKGQFESGVIVNVPVTPSFGVYAIGYAKNSEAHAIVDFQIGKDVGVGLLGRGTDTVISFGARYAQMNTRSKAHAYAKPAATFHQITFLGKYSVGTEYRRSASFVDRIDSVRALGPSLSMKNTTGLLGTVDDGQLALDWGINGAVLFGRQKVEMSHHTTIVHAYGQGFAVPPATHIYSTMPRPRSRMVTIPNLGGFAGLSFRIQNAKFSAGYRADFFFGARDSGLETRSTTDVGFHGPFATISIGLGG